MRLGNLRSLEVLGKPSRVSSLDVFRSVAIVVVVLFHFNNFLPYGNLGVDLFFVISGFLVGGILIRKFQEQEKIVFSQFILQRGFKIWPSYYVFVILAGILSYVFYRNLEPAIVLSIDQYSRLLLFYQNYTGGTVIIFGHVWSLCVEEHFYIILPILFLIVNKLGSNPSSRLRLFWMMIFGFIISGVLFKCFSINFLRSKDTFSGTHNRLDALGWGLLLAAIHILHEKWFRTLQIRKYFFLLGIFLFALMIFILETGDSYFFMKVVFRSVIPISFFLMIGGTLYHDFSSWLPLRFISYYSYNWYLWHPLFGSLVIYFFGSGIPGLLVYIGFTFLVAMVLTILIEEPVLRWRDRLMPSLFSAGAGSVQLKHASGIRH